MLTNGKYSRTYHFSFSPGTTSDDRIKHDWWECLKQIKKCVLTEKIDGQNNAFAKSGVFARSHGAVSRHKWDNHLKEKHSLIKDDLDGLEIFGENMFAIHSIEYLNLESYFYVFAVRDDENWLSFEDVNTYATMIDYPTVPVLGYWSYDLNKDEKQQKEDFIKLVKDLSSQPSVFGSVDANTGDDCTREGVVVRNIESFSKDDFSKNVFKFVRESHVKTDVHWTRNWRRAKLNWEKKNG